MSTFARKLRISFKKSKDTILRVLQKKARDSKKFRKKESPLKDYSFDEM